MNQLDETRCLIDLLPAMPAAADEIFFHILATQPERLRFGKKSRREENGKYVRIVPHSSLAQRSENKFIGKLWKIFF